MPGRRSKSAASGGERRGRGRPRVDDPGEVVTVRLNADDRKKLDELDVKGEGRSAVVRHLIRDAHGRFMRTKK